MEQFAHFDPLNFIVVLGAVLAAWYKFLRKGDAIKTTVDSLARWSEKHASECDETRKTNSAILSELRESNTRLSTIASNHHERMEKTDDEILRLRDRQHDLMNALQKVRQ